MPSRDPFDDPFFKEPRRVVGRRMTPVSRDPFDDPFFKDFERSSTRMMGKTLLYGVIAWIVVLAAFAAIVLGALAIAGVI